MRADASVDAVDAEVRRVFIHRLGTYADRVSFQSWNAFNPKVAGPAEIVVGTYQKTKHYAVIPFPLAVGVLRGLAEHLDTDLASVTYKVACHLHSKEHFELPPIYDLQRALGAAATLLALSMNIFLSMRVEETNTLLGAGKSVAVATGMGSCLSGSDQLVLGIQQGGFVPLSDLIANGDWRVVLGSLKCKKGQVTVMWQSKKQNRGTGLSGSLHTSELWSGEISEAFGLMAPGNLAVLVSILLHALGDNFDPVALRAFMNKRRLTAVGDVWEVCPRFARHLSAEDTDLVIL